MLKKKRVSLVKFKLSFLKKTPYISWLQKYDNIKYIGREELFKKIKIKVIREYITRNIKCKNSRMFLILNEEKDPIGTCKIAHIDWYHKRGDFGILIDSTYQGKGYGAEAASLLINYSFKILKLNKITGGCLKKNIAMKNIFFKNKFRQEGSHKNHTRVKNKFLDHVSYGLLKKDFYNLL